MGLGLLGAIAGPLIGNIFGRSNARYSQSLADASDGSKLQRMVKDAKAAGINTYAALMGGAGASGAGPGPRVVSDTAWAGAFDRVEEILTGQQAASNKQDALNKELERVAIDTAGRGAQPSNVTNRGPSLAANSSEVAMTPPGVTPRPDDLPPISDERRDMEYDVGNFTETGTLTRPTYPHPNLRDLDGLEQRAGEAPELASLIGYPTRMVRDAGYSRRLEAFAAANDMSVRDAHQIFLTDPNRMDELPSLGSAMVQEAFSDVRLPRIQWPVTVPRYTPRVP